MLWITLGTGRGGMERAMQRIAHEFDSQPTIEILPNHPGFLGRVRATKQIHDLATGFPGDTHLFGSTTISLGALALLASRTPFVAWVRNSLKDTGSGLKRYLLKWALGRASRISANSLGISKEVRSLLGGRGDVLVLPNWSPLPRRPGQCDTGALSSTAPILWCSRLGPAKRPADVLHGFARAQIDRPLVLLGEGPYLQDLQQLAANLGITDRTRFVGHVAEPTPWYRNAFAFVFSSDFDATANSLLEALAAGLPVVAFEGQGADEVLLEGQYGLYHSTGDFDGFARSLESLESPACRRQWSRLAKDRAAHFSLDRLRVPYEAFVAPDTRASRHL